MTTFQPRGSHGQLFDCPRCGRTNVPYDCLGLCHNCYLARWVATQVVPDDYDDVAVRRLMCGERVSTYRGDRIEAVRRLTSQGRSASDIADLLGVAGRTVFRDRRALANTAGVR